MKSFVKSILFRAMLLIAGLGAASTGSAQSSGDLYWGLSVGPSFVSENDDGESDVEFNTGFVGAGQVGYIFDRVRADLEVAFSRADIDEIDNVDSDSDLQIYEATLNLTYGCQNQLFGFDCVYTKPYIGAGFGVSHLILDNGADDEVTGLTAHGELGVSYSTNRKIDLVAVARLSWYEADLDGLDNNPVSGQIRIGARFYY